jgi:uncharacterized repeat protein (TIGR03847 family)
MSEQFEFDYVDFITVDTIGAPGQRVFHLQAGQGERLITLLIEKEQAIALADSIYTILEEITEKFGRKTPEKRGKSTDLELHEPILPRFRIAQLGLGYDSENDRLILLANELVSSEEANDPGVVRLGASRAQMRALAIHAREVVAGGRPICGNCGRPIDPDGHFCPKSNGHRKAVAAE